MGSKEIKHFDIHGHVSFPAFDADRDQVIARAYESGVAMITVGTDIETSRKAIEIAERYDNVWATVGMHPVHTCESVNDPFESGRPEKNIRAPQYLDKQAFLELANHPKVVAIGECGLDYFHVDESGISREKEIFIEQIDIANTVGKPLMLHVRNPKAIKTDNSGLGNKDNGAKAFSKSAYLDAVEILKEHAKVDFDFHFFSGSMEEARAILDIGGYVSFDGPITFAQEYESVVRNVPLDRIMSETDCPYASPVPYRGKRNEPVYVIEIVKAIARIKGQSLEDVARILLDNAKSFFHL